MILFYNCFVLYKYFISFKTKYSLQYELHKDDNENSCHCFFCYISEIIILFTTKRLQLKEIVLD